MTLDEIYNEFTPGTIPFANAVITYCGLDLSRSEIRRIGEEAPTADAFRALAGDRQPWWAD